MIILGIETSCDDTCVALIRASGKKKPKFKILSNIVSSQIEVHKKYGGVYPFLAKREHQKNLPLVVSKTLKKNLKIDLIAVTNGPGLEPCLWVGVNFAKTFAYSQDIPIRPVNHIEAHILVNLINKDIKFPALALIVSGGHTQLILVKGIGKYKIIGETRDDAAGECFDKVAKILGLGYPGGPIISKRASQNKGASSFNIKLPRPMINQKNYDFSFSGLKTAVLYNYKKEKSRKSKKYIQEMSQETQQAIIDVLIKKTLRAAREYGVKTIILGGGVSANQELRKQFKSQWKNRLLVPDKKLSTDNAVMTAIAGYFGKPKDWRKIKADANLRI
jgi:N6-L-threonylcarbamoyladenine synthase